MLNGTNKENCGNVKTQGSFGREVTRIPRKTLQTPNSLGGKEYKSIQLFYVLQCLLDIVNVTSACYK